MEAHEHIDTEAAFRRELTRILNQAASNGVDVEGAWAISNDDPDRPDWDLEIVTLSESGE